MINAKVCQNIVSRVTNILDRNINIINLQGIVIASSNMKRIGSFHEGGKLCADNGAEVIITKENKHLYRGCKEGVNLPIQYKNKIIGIVGITGNPIEIKPYGLLVKELVELIVQENESRYAKELHEQALRSFIIELIKGTQNNEEKIYINRAKLLGINDLRNKILTLGEINFLNEECRDEIKRQEIKQKILEYIKLYYRTENLIVFYLYEEIFLMLLPEGKLEKNSLNKITRQIQEKFNTSITFVVSDVCKTYKDYPINYSKIERALVINNYAKDKEHILFISDYEIDLLINSIPLENKMQYLKNYNNFLDKQNDKIYEELKHTIKVYFENNMNIGNTANQLYVHRNTISYRINKIKKEYNIDITLPYECMKLYIAICISEQP